MPAFDSDWASPAEWVGLYRSFGLQVVPCHRPAGAADQTWKHPKLASWKQFATDAIPETVYEKWYGPGGEFAASPQMGMITGEASGRTVCLDLDTHKSSEAADWWRGLLTVENYGREPETWKAISGSGGRHLFFKYPPGFAMPTAKTTIGVDLRGQGGFIVLAPTVHNSGRAYAWEDGFAPWQADLAVAPEWLIIAIEEVIRRHGGGGKSRERTTATAELNAFGRRVDGRETYMVDVVWAALIDRHREWDFPGTPPASTVEEWEKQAFAVYRDNVASRLPPDGSSDDDRLEREGRGWTAFKDKWQAAFRKWDTAIAEEAKKPRDVPEQEQPLPGVAVPSLFTPHPYVCRDPAGLARREWLYGRHLVRGYLSMLVAPGGSGKTTLAIAEALDMVSGRGFLEEVPEPLRVLFWCGEDPLDELERRFAAGCLHYGLGETDLGGRLFLNSGCDDPLRLATEERKGLIVNTALRDAITEAIRRERIDVAIFDPFITTHLVNENSNVAVNAVADVFKQIARDAGCAIYLLVHSRKPQALAGEVTANDARGAGAQIDAARIVRVLNRMSTEEAQQAGIEPIEQRRLFRVDDGKQNMAPLAELAKWRRLESVDLGNGAFGLAGDSVQVAIVWRAPGPFDRVTEQHLCEVQRRMGDQEFSIVPQAQDWLGYLIGEVTGIDTASVGGRKHLQHIIAGWVKAGVIVKGERWNEKSKRMQATYRCGSRDRGTSQSRS
jgi:AAA domain/Bifunctional DNA primase/polymerase, N-terminal